VTGAQTVSSSDVQTLSASSLFSASDADGDTLSYYLYDANSAVSSGYLSVNGNVVPPEFVYSVTAAQLAQTSFVAGAAGTADELRVIAFDGQTFSNDSVFTYLHVNAMGPAAGATLAGGSDSFVFKPGLGQQTAVDFSQGVPDNYTPLSFDHFNQTFGTAVVPSIGGASDTGHGEAAVDLLAVFGLHAADHGHFLF
jgi:hypothetical protein